MTETPLQMQLRLRLETECSRVFNRLISLLRPYDVTLLAYDFGAEGHIAYKTSLTVEGMIEVFGHYIRAWEAGTPRIIEPKPGEQIPRFDAEDMRRLSEFVRAALPSAAYGFSLFVGKGEATQYVATGERQSVLGALKELIANIEADG